MEKYLKQSTQKESNKELAHNQIINKYVRSLT